MNPEIDYIRIIQIGNYVNQNVILKGWIYNFRVSKQRFFLELRDGSGIIQCIVNKNDVPISLWESCHKLTQESSIHVQGIVKEDERSKIGYEIDVKNITIIQLSQNYPITPKEHGINFLLENRHLWLRGQRQWAIMRVRNAIIHAIHDFFQERGFIHTDTPIFTSNPAEGTTTLFETDYFDEKAYLAQSGQLYGEALAMAHGLIYTFGPTFRAESSKTRRHLTEFWMIEPEMAFYDLNMTMQLAEELIQHILKNVLIRTKYELSLLNRDTTKLSQAAENTFSKISYTNALDILKSQKMYDYLDGMEENKKNELGLLQKEMNELMNQQKGKKTYIQKKWQACHTSYEDVKETLRNIPVWKKSLQNLTWGKDFGGSDETLLTSHFSTPIIVYNYPTEIKAFYMKRDTQNEKIALAMDVLAPEGYGEIIGGSQREDNPDILKQRIKEHHLDANTFSWYMDLRYYGSVPHSGFGMGLERLVAWICGVKHLRECIPFPRLMDRLRP